MNSLSATTDAAPAASAPSFDQRLYRKLAWRIMPFLFLCFVLN